MLGIKNRTLFEVTYFFVIKSKLIKMKKVEK